MELRKIEDRGGEVFVRKYYDGVHFPPNVPGNVKDHLETLRNLKHKEGDILLNSFPKTGTHWTYDVLHMLLTGKAEYSIGKIMAMDYEPTEKFDALDSPRILVSHLYPKHIPKSVIDEKCKIVYIYRNPKDTAVSMHSFIKRLNIDGFKGYNGKWEHFLEMFATKQLQYNTWFEHVKSWLDYKEDNPDFPIMFVSYEDMKKNLRRCVQKMAEYLGAKQDPEFLDEVAKKCQFSAMSKAKTTDETETAFSRDGSNPFYRKGEVGDWKNWFTVAQNEIYDEVIEEKMAGIDLELKYTL
ncbi:sulfotransferase family cytosolic 1B member 1-like isoform X2 [Pecten maximus]|uniref:sulfotransferase family cytosolic 1B member 1-like isoform X2 n=1 Tax=Pecten maximus TaxID=6579 RepID=UPI0014589755|nr:sulfotransferase family cytosolic 1B member 1-like isoform X2 [Pecten maximus]